MKTFSIISLFISISSFAAKGIVTVLEAPLFRTKSLQSKVIQWVRKGEIIYIHEKHTFNPPTRRVYERITDIDNFDIDEQRALKLEKDTFERIDPELRIFDEDYLINDQENIEKRSSKDPFDELILSAPISETSYLQNGEQEDQILLDLEEIDKFNPTFSSENEDLSEELQVLFPSDDKIEDVDEILRDETSTQNNSSIFIGRSDFYTTIDRNGLTAFIPKEYVKLIYKDERELDEEISQFDYDPTDYRLEEPLSKYHPFYQKTGIRLSTLLGITTGPQKSYPYLRSVSDQDYSIAPILVGSYLSRVEIPKQPHLYFGVRGSFSAEKNKFKIAQDNSVSREEKLRLSIGPTFVFDLWDIKKIRISFIAGPTITYERTTVSQSINTTPEERTFRGLGFGANFGVLAQWMDKRSLISFTSEMGLNLMLPYELSSKHISDTDGIWQNKNDDFYAYQFQGNAYLALGIQFNL